MTRNPATDRWEPSSAASSTIYPAGVDRACLVANLIEELLTIAPKEGPLCKLRLKPGQAILLDFIADRWARRVPLLALIPKPRQFGISTFIQAVIFIVQLLHERAGRPYRAATIAHIEETARTIFSMSRLFEKKLPKAWRLPIESSQQGRIEWAGGSRNVVVSAKLGDGAGKGFPLNAIHGSEVANWADLGQDPQVLWSSLLGTMGELAAHPDTIVILESTAKGRDPFFHQMIVQSRRNASRYPVLFLPWYLEPGFTMTWEQYRSQRPLWEDMSEKFEPTLEEIALREFLSQRIVKPGEEWCVYRVDLTDEQLIWRRAEKESHGEDLFKRYYPSTLEECFAASEHAFISDQKVIDRMWRQFRVPTARGDVHEPGCAWKPSSVGYIHRWHAPELGRSYVIGADVSEGLAAGDFQAAYVLDQATLEVVAAVHTKADPDDYSAILNRLGRYYNNALIAVENNFSPSVVLGLRKNGYPNVYWHKDPDQLRGRPPKPGFNTNKRTRSVILDTLRSAILADQLRFNDEGFLNEVGTFVHNERADTFKAARGSHDDRVMAMAIAVYVCGKRPRPEASPDAPVASDPGYEAWQRNKRRAAERKRYARINGETTTGGGCPL